MYAMEKKRMQLDEHMIENGRETLAAAAGGGRSIPERAARL